MGTELRCANCGQRLEATDKFCRECGLPTLHRSETQRVAAASTPNVDELKLAMEVQPGAANFVQTADTGRGQAAPPPELTTGSVIKVTNPTFAAKLAGSTALMVVAVVILVLVGISLIVLALKF